MLNNVHNEKIIEDIKDKYNINNYNMLIEIHISSTNDSEDVCKEVYDFIDFLEYFYKCDLLYNQGTYKNNKNMGVLTVCKNDDTYYIKDTVISSTNGSTNTNVYIYMINIYNKYKNDKLLINTQRTIEDLYEFTM